LFEPFPFRWELLTKQPVVKHIKDKITEKRNIIFFLIQITPFTVQVTVSA
jgi:hypothetical protein